jgi:DNA adenine methylase
MFYSPLRYPGGKNKLSAFLAQICIDNKIDSHYVEPYAGGASVALFLLLEGYVERITINDKDKAIYAFWHSVLNETDSLCHLIENTDISVQEWRKQKIIQSDKSNTNLLELGFSTLFLNRTNRSGIINGGMIGGAKQLGSYLVDCRFNKKGIIKRIKNIAARRENINVYCMDALDLIDKIESDAEICDNTLFYFDPPYYLKASSLYMNHYDNDNHALVCNRIKEIKNIKWIVSYDNVPEICNLYQNFLRKEYSFKHTAYEIREGKEILFFSPSLQQPDIEDWTPIGFKLRRNKSGKKIVYKPLTIVEVGAK